MLESGPEGGPEVGEVGRLAGRKKLGFLRVRPYIPYEILEVSRCITNAQMICLKSMCIGQSKRADDLFRKVGAIIPLAEDSGMKKNLSLTVS